MRFPAGSQNQRLNTCEYDTIANHGILPPLLLGMFGKHPTCPAFSFASPSSPFTPLCAVRCLFARIFGSGNALGNSALAGNGQVRNGSGGNGRVGNGKVLGTAQESLWYLFLFCQNGSVKGRNGRLVPTGVDIGGYLWRPGGAKFSSQSFIDAPVFSIMSC